MAGGRPINFSILADDRDFAATVRAADRQLVGLGNSSIEAEGKISKSFKGISESADSVATKGAQVAGGLSGIGGTLTAMGVPAGQTLTNIGTGLQFLADTGDVVAGTLDSMFGIVGKAKDAAAALGLFSAAEDEAAVAADGLAASEDAVAASETLALGPILAVVAAVALVVAGIVAAIKYHKQIEAVVRRVWGAIKDFVAKTVGKIKDDVTGAFSAIKDKVSHIVGDVLDWLRKHWGLIVSILGGPIGAVAVQIAKHWSDITSGAKDLYHDVTGFLGDIVHFVTGVPGKIAKAAEGMFDGIKRAAYTVFGWVASIWNDTLGKINFSIPGWVPVIGGDSFGFPTITVPALASGGITTGPTLAMIGDNPGGREAVIPLDRYPDALGGKSTEVHVHVHFNGIVGDQRRAARQVVDVFRSYISSGGTGLTGLGGIAL